jgi:23S rRNA pseudouridine2604 synthase
MVQSRMSEDRPKLTVKAGAPSRDPRRRSVRPGAPRAPAAKTAAAEGGPAPAKRPPGPKPFKKTPARVDASRTAARPQPTAQRVQPAAPHRNEAVAPAEGVRLSKILSDQGQASRREADDWIAAGWVRVDGEMAVLGQRVLPHQRIDIDPAARTQQAKQVTVLLNKPIGYVSGQAEDGYEPAVVLVTRDNRWPQDRLPLQFHPGHLRNLAPAGRLDIDSTGLLVLTQDGRIAKHLIGDDSQVEKEYLVRVEPLQPGRLPDDLLQRLSHGLELDGVKLKPAKVSWQNEDQLRFVLREGRKRQIRRMCELVGLKVVGLRRVRIGSVVLGQLPVGQWRYLGEHERF